MNRVATIALASLASLAAAAASHGQTYGGFSVAAGVPRIVATVNQTAAPASNATSYLTVQRCTGVFEYPVFAVVSATTCIANGPDYRITMEVVSPTQTKVTILATAATCGIKTVSFGTPNSQCGYDLLNPNPGTVNSLAGANPVPVAMAGIWTVRIGFDNIVKYAAVPAVGDLYSRMTVYFSSCFDVGDQFQFTVDTDRIS